MHPSDDLTIRVHLLIRECRELRRRLAERVAESRALRARAARLRARAEAWAAEENVSQSWGGREMG